GDLAPCCRNGWIRPKLADGRRVFRPLPEDPEGSPRRAGQTPVVSRPPGVWGVWNRGTARFLSLPPARPHGAGRPVGQPEGDSPSATPHSQDRLRLSSCFLQLVGSGGPSVRLADGAPSCAA